jgi:undecaprenyl-diphosphatase
MKRAVKKPEFVLLATGLFVGFIADPFVAGLELRTRFFDGIFSWITNLGSVIVVLVLMSSLFLWEENKKRQIPVLWVSFIASGAAGYLLKLIVQRPRLVAPAYVLSGSSFPSVHTAIAFATLPLLDKEFPHLKWFWFGFCVLVALSRVYFKYHYLSDVFAGAVLGYLVGYLVLAKLHRLTGGGKDGV